MTEPSAHDARDRDAPRGDLPDRDIARALVFDPRDRLLLIAYEAVRDVDPERPGERGFWFMPGGGLEAGEDHRTALLRELEEEIGVANAPAGPEVARCEGPFTLFRKPRHARERYYAVRLPDDRVDTRRLAETEDNPVLGVKWWTLDELAEAERTGSPRVEPRGLAGVAVRVAAGEDFAEPITLSWRPGAA